jgi:hypothetical protein
MTSIDHLTSDPLFVLVGSKVGVSHSIDDSLRAKQPKVEGLVAVIRSVWRWPSKKEREESVIQPQEGNYKCRSPPRLLSFFISSDTFFGSVAYFVTFGSVKYLVPSKDIGT